jgi:glutamyl-tRNA reductase
MKLFAVGLSYKTASVALRKQLVVKDSEIVDLPRALKSAGDLDEIVLLSTCNRVEIYGTTEGAFSDIKYFFLLLSSEPRELNDHVYVHGGVDAVRHLFHVAAGLDSKVLGETKITGQVKNAYEIARANAIAYGNRLCQTSK